ncbi:MAG: DUF1294 domain-containing protein [Bacteroidales bacterium]|nr:DUF1294 domain-containing protein [Bacteroidales bacterium]
MNVWYLVAIYIVLISIITFIAYAIDKRKARKGKWRTPESTLIGLAVVGGSVGALLAMKFLRHKTQHKKFYIGVPLIFCIQIVLVVYALFV